MVMGLGAEVAAAIVGLWALCLRPMLIKYAGEMAEALGNHIGRIIRSRRRRTSRTRHGRSWVSIYY
ncbi:hypothetical protein RchiOBHm_Chr5g0034691 [Rosa chinensis]|uniref:Uncharacterized protein n=1 Tax=Rosa chinensis TaxID=74649 RepID=A0A2P6QB10_ROSCH|nr:hypothetical protein RchiOBHm_Chr5g0034691 [Rosa chinensis]